MNLENNDNALSVIGDFEKGLARVTSIPQARTLLSGLKGYSVAATQQWTGAKTLPEGSQERADVLESAIQVSGLRLRVEARLGELIRQEQEAGRLATKDSGNRNLPNNVVRLKDYGISWMDSSRAQKVLDNISLIPVIMAEARESGDPPTRYALERKVLEQKREVSKEQKGKAAEGSQYSEGSGVLTGDLSLLDGATKDDDADLFFTDPPYGEDTLYLFGRLAELAQKKLKPGGLCLTYTPHEHLPLIMNDMSKYLEYFWIFAVEQTGQEARIWKNSIWVKWKPILVFTKKPRSARLTEDWVMDSIRGAGEDKRYHEWGQDVQEATYWIEKLTPLNGLVVDPFCGGGTIPLASKITGRRWLASDIDGVAASTARKRLSE